MGSVGLDVVAPKLAAFVLAGAMAGVAGHMWEMTEGFIDPELLGWQRSAEGLLAVLLGGLLFLHGPVVGAVAFLMIGEVAGMATERSHGVEGAVILLVPPSPPQGVPGIRLRRPAPRARAAEAEP